VIGAGLVALAAVPAGAGDLLSARDRDWIIGLHGAVWAETQLPKLPYNIVTGNLRFRDAQLLQLSLSRVIVKDFSVPLPGDLSLNGNSVELQVIGAQHFGLEDHQEVVAALNLRSGEIPLFGDVSFNFAWANGLSYALQPPKLERGPGGLRGVDTRQFQYYMGIEQEWTFARDARWHFVTMLHHRSGIYGLISPQKTGSNYMGAGLNIDF
jgi:hypothetical protein